MPGALGGWRDWPPAPSATPPPGPSPPAGASCQWGFYGQFPWPPGCEPPGRWVYGLSNEPEVQTAPGESSWAGAAAWGTAPQVPGPHYAPGLGPFTSCLFAGWVPGAHAGPVGVLGSRWAAGRQPAVVQSGGMKGDLVLYDSLGWLMGSPRACLPACLPEALSSLAGGWLW